MASTYEYLCNPRSVAVFGASAKEGNWGFELVKALLSGGYTGSVYPINPKGGTLLGLPMYTGISEIGQSVDMAVIGIRAELVLRAVRECRHHGVKVAVIISGGFAETGPEGRALQEAVLEAAGDMRLVGPNTLGIADLEHGFNASVLSPRRGAVAMLCQSGNMTDEIEHLIRRKGLGFTKFFDFGNQMDLGTCDFLECVAEDDATKAVILHMEGLKPGEGGRFIAAARRLVRKKPVIAVKAGVTEAGLKAAGSHTGALAGNDTFYDAAFRQAGILRVKNPTELVETAEVFVHMPPIKGRAVAILTDGGGHTTLACDLLGEYGLTLPALTDETQEKLRGLLLKHSPVRNPVDFAGALEADLRNLPKAAALVLADPNVDGLMVIGTHLGEYARWSAEVTDESVALELARVIREGGKPVVCQNYLPDETLPAVEALRRCGVPVYTQIESAVRALGALAQYREILLGADADGGRAHTASGASARAESILDGAAREGRKALLETEARELLEQYGVPVQKSVLVRTRADAASACRRLEFPLAAKIVSPQIIHKTDAGGVLLNLRNEADVLSACDTILENVKRRCPEAEITGILLSPMARPGTEVIVGMLRDPQFGPVLMAGLGGVLVEVLGDVAFRVAPLTARDAGQMLGALKGKALLGGVRGAPPKDVGAIIDVLLKVSRLVTENAQIGELDLNPLIVYENGLVALDARVILN